MRRRLGSDGESGEKGRKSGLYVVVAPPGFVFLDKISCRFVMVLESFSRSSCPSPEAYGDDVVVPGVRQLHEKVGELFHLFQPGKMQVTVRLEHRES